MKVKINEIRKLLELKLKDRGFTSKESRVIAHEFLLGELKGKTSHGIFSFIRGARGSRVYSRVSGVTRGYFKVTSDRPSYAYIEGNKDAGQLVADYAIKLAIKKARKTGIAMVGAGNIHAFLRPGTWAEIAARKGMIGLCFNYGGGPLIAPTGAREPLISTNPIGIGIPYKPFPFVIDMATSVRAYYHVKMARALGKKIGRGIGIDKMGQPTTDPNKLIALLPFGGYKGYALSLALEMLTGPLVRTKVGKRTKRLRGFLFIVINPTAFTTRKEFDRDVRQLVRELKALKRTKGTKEIFIPGEQAYRNEQKNLKRGYLEIDEKIMESIEAL